MAIIADRRTFVALELGNRADLLVGDPSRIDNWIWQSYLNLSNSYNFPEAELTVIDTWQPSMDSIAWPDDARAIKALTFYRQNGTPIRVNWKDINYIRRYPGSALSLPLTSNPLPSIGPPAVVAMHGNLIYVRPLADSSGPYPFILDYWQKPIPAQGSLGNTVLLVPDEWLEIIDYGAKMRGHADLGEVEKASALQNLLFGVTIPTTGKFVPGMIANMWTRRQAQAPYTDYGIKPKGAGRSYTNVP